MSDSNINKIIDQVNIVEVVGEYLDLQKKGRNFWGLCPFHQDANPSMSVSPEKRIFKCFVCGAGGNVINFVSDFEKISFGKALVKLAGRIGLEIENNFDPKPVYNEVQQQLISALKDANDFYQYSLSTPEAKEALAYADTRGLDAKTRETFKIGFAPGNGLIDFLSKKNHDSSTLINASLTTNNNSPFLKNRLTFGITNDFGDIIGFSGRLLAGDGPKYINSVESQVFDKSSVLYNFYNARDVIIKEKEVYITEGFMDVIAMTKAGFRNTVAIMGTALTKSHIRKLKDVKVNLMLDSDEAGIIATLKSIALLLSNNISTQVVINKIGKDADEIVNSQGVEVLKTVVQNKVSVLQFVYAILKHKYQPNSPESIQTFVKEFLKYLSVTNALEKDFYINKIIDEFKLSKAAIATLIPNYVNSTSKEKLPRAKEKSIDFIKENQSYKLIRSFLNKPHLREIIIKDNKHVHFADIMLINLWRYIQDMAEGKNVTPTDAHKAKVKEILEESDEVVETKEEFEDLIKIVNNETKMQQANTVNVKLKNASSHEEKVVYLNQLRKLKQRK